MHDDTLVPLRRLAREVPSGRIDGPVHPKTLGRWARFGLRGVRLEVTRVGGTVCSSRAALMRFFERLTVADGLGGDRRSVAQDLPDRQARAEREADELLGRG